MTDWSKVLSVPGGVQVRTGNRVDYLVDGWATYQSMYDAICTTFKKEPSYYIYLLAWWLDDDFLLSESDRESTFWQLIQKASTQYGVQVRILLWSNMLAGIPGISIETVKTAGKNVLFPNSVSVPIAPQLKQVSRYNSLPGAGAILDGQQPTMFQSHHQKVLIIKGSQGLVSFCGGLDIAQDRVRHITLHDGSPFHDVHCRIVGNATRDLLDVFVERWRSHPDSTAIDGARGKLRCLADLAPVNNSKPAGEQSVGIARTFNAPVGNNWGATELSIAAIFRSAIRAARRFIYIEDQYLVSAEAAALLRQALPVIQKLIILIPERVELPFCTIMRQQFYKALTEGDQKLAEKVRIFHRPTGNHEYIHAKTWIFDDELAIIGSANCNRRGWNGDSEVAAAIFDTPASSDKKSFAQNLRRHLWSEHTGAKEGDLNDPTNVKPWDAAANGGKLRVYQPQAYDQTDQLKDGAFLTLLDTSVATIWDHLSDPMPKPFPLLPQNNRETKRAF